MLGRYLGLARLIWAAQGKACPICGDAMLPVHRRHPTRGWSIEHVWPKGRYQFRLFGNILITHVECNNGKHERDPTGCEQLILAAVNAQLGFELREREEVEYRDLITAPTALAIAFEQARLRAERGVQT